MRHPGRSWYVDYHLTTVSRISKMSWPTWDSTSIASSHCKSKKFLPLFLCDIVRNELFTKIYVLDQLAGHQVTVPAYRNNRKGMCYKCQRYGHSSNRCFMNWICVKCNGNHLSRGCVMPRNQIGNHCSNFSQWPRNPKVMRELKEKNIKDAKEKRTETNKNHSKLLQWMMLTAPFRFPPCAPRMWTLCLQEPEWTVPSTATRWRVITPCSRSETGTSLRSPALGVLRPC